MNSLRPTFLGIYPIGSDFGARVWGSKWVTKKTMAAAATRTLSERESSFFDGKK